MHSRMLVIQNPIFHKAKQLSWVDKIGSRHKVGYWFGETGLQSKAAYVQYSLITSGEYLHKIRALNLTISKGLSIFFNIGEDKICQYMLLKIKLSLE